MVHVQDISGADGGHRILALLYVFSKRSWSEAAREQTLNYKTADSNHSPPDADGVRRGGKRLQTEKSVKRRLKRLIEAVHTHTDNKNNANVKQELQIESKANHSHLLIRSPSLSLEIPIPIPYSFSRPLSHFASSVY